jgi:energy-converting hydrogenase Eha subunit H
MRDWDIRINISSFLLIILINLVCWTFYWMTHPENIVYKNKEIYKEKQVKVDDKGLRYVQLLQVAAETCKNSLSTDSKGLLDFKLDDKDRPVFHCRY